MKNESALANLLLGLSIIIMNIITVCIAESLFIVITGVVLILFGGMMVIWATRTILDAYVEKKVKEYLTFFSTHNDPEE